MSSVIIAGDTSGTVTLQAPDVAGSTVITLPSTSMTLGPAYTGLSTVVFESSTTWEVPAGITQARITVIGAGGGGRTSATTAQGGKGGGAIAYCTGLSGTLTITVGTGGTGGATPTAGGTSSITGAGISISCTGGGGATSGVVGTNGTGTITTGTALKVGVSDSTVNPLVNLGATNYFATPTPWSPSISYTAGQGGLTNSSTCAGSSGVVVIEY